MLCDLRIESFCAMHSNLRIQRPLVAGICLRGIWVVLRPVLVGIVVKKVRLDKVFPCHAITPILRTHFRVEIAVTRKTSGQRK
jgi:hypothetical protein